MIPLYAICALLLWSVPGEAVEIQQSARSREVVRRVSSSLSTQLHDREFILGSPIYLRIFKDEKEVEVWIEDREGFRLFKVYSICTYSGDLGPKLQEGDRQSPEGFYHVGPRQLNPYSHYHLSFDLGFPNSYDRVNGRTGSALMVHGDCVSIGCYAMTDEGIEEIYTLAEKALSSGQPFFRVHVFPFRMTERNLKDHQDSEWREFWGMMKEGHDFFENVGRPPNVEVCGGRYIFN